MRNHATLFRPVDGGYQAVTTSGTSAATSNAVGDQTYQVALFCDQDVHVRFGKTPTATTSDLFLPASTMVFFPIAPGEKVAGIQSSAAGTLHVSELTT